MDILKLALSTGPIKDWVAKQIRNILFVKTGYHADVSLNDISVTNKDGKVYLHMDVNAEMTSKEFMDILNKLTS